MALSLQFFVAGFIALIIYFVLSQKRPKKFPPGPLLGFPLLGHLPLLGNEPHKTMIKWLPKYGPIVGVNFGSFKCVFISDYKLIKEAMNDLRFAGRPKLPPMLDRSGGKLDGIICNEGPKWAEQRRFTLRTLREFGFGTKSMEAIIQDEIREVIERFKLEVGYPISTSNRFNVSVVNGLWTILTGERFDHDNPELNRVVELFTQNLQDNTFASLGLFVPWIAKYLPDWLSQYQTLIAPYQPITDFLQPYIDSHFKNHIVGHPRDFLDAYIDEIKITKDPASSFHIEQKNTFLFTLIDLFVAGSETTSSTLTWIFLYMARFPEIQEKLAEEILNIIGNSRMPSLSDRPQMPYLEAVIHEIMRHSTFLPLSVMHATTEDVSFHGYEIPKDTMVMINVYEAHHNVSLWGDPENFRPQRFLSDDGTKFIKQDGFMPFSTGKRVCLGEGLSRDELFLFTSSLFQVFKVSVDPKEKEPPSLIAKTGIFRFPFEHKLVLTLRQA